MTLEYIQNFCKQHHFPFEEKEYEQLFSLLQNEAELFHLAKTHPEEAVLEATFFIEPGF